MRWFSPVKNAPSRKWSFPFLRLKRAGRECQVYVHIGPHKTGTTTIQQMLLYAGDSIVYPVPEGDGPGHHRLALKLMGDVSDGRGGNVLIETVSRSFPLDHSRPFVLSSETFAKAAYVPGVPSRFAELADAYPTQLIITHRPVTKRACSILQEFVKHGSFKVMDGNGFRWEELSRIRTLEEGFFERMIGMAKWRRSHVVLVDDNNPLFIADAFSSILGVPLDKSQAAIPLNRRIPYMRLRMLADLHREGTGETASLLLERSGRMFEELAAKDPSLAAMPYPALPADVLWRMEALDAEHHRRLIDLQRQGLVEIHRPNDPRAVS